MEDLKLEEFAKLNEESFDLERKAKDILLKESKEDID